MGEPLVFLLVGGAAVVAGLARGGLLRGLTETSVRDRSLGLACLGVLLAVARANGRMPGVPLIALGLLLNLAAVVANAGMPTSESTLASAGVAVERPLPHRPDAKHVLAGEGTRLALLGDRLAVRPLRAVVSYGTVSELAGLFLLLQHLVLGATAFRREDGTAHGAHEARTVPWTTWAD